MNQSNKPMATKSDRSSEYQHDPFVVDWSCVTSKKD